MLHEAEQQFFWGGDLCVKSFSFPRAHPVQCTYVHCCPLLRGQIVTGEELGAYPPLPTMASVVSSQADIQLIKATLTSKKPWSYKATLLSKFTNQPGVKKRPRFRKG